jgi:hypothetical protein
MLQIQDSKGSKISYGLKIACNKISAAQQLNSVGGERGKLAFSPLRSKKEAANFSKVQIKMLTLPIFFWRKASHRVFTLPKYCKQVRLAQFKI